MGSGSELPNDNSKERLGVPEGPQGGISFPLLFSLMATLALAFFSYIAGRRDGSWSAPLTWDSANYFGNAILIKRAISDHYFWTAWVHTSGTHTPLVPTLSALLMLVFGESRHVAEAVMPIFTFIYILSVVRIVQLLYPAARGVARSAPYVAALLCVTFPAALNLSRIYLFEYPLASLVAASGWALLRTANFQNLFDSIVFGIVAGLASLSRGGGPVFLAGPMLVVAWMALRSPNRGRSIRNMLLGAIPAALIAGSWYIPNFTKFIEYIHSVTYGDRASQYTVSGTSLSWAGAWAQCAGIVTDGPGVPALATAAFSYGAACIVSKSWLGSRTVAALFTVLAIDFAIVSFASQTAGGVLMMPTFPILAIFLCRSATVHASQTLQCVVLTVLGGLSVHHLYDLTWGFIPEYPQSRMNARVGSVELWNHKNLYIDVMADAYNHRGTEGRVRQVCDRLAEVPIDRFAQVWVLVDDPVFQPTNFRLDALERRTSWSFNYMHWTGTTSQLANRKELRKNLIDAHAVVFEDLNGNPGTDMERWVRDSLAPVVPGPASRYVRLGDPIPVENGHALNVYVRRPDIEWRDEPLPGVPPLTAKFTNVNDDRVLLKSIELTHAGYACDEEQQWLVLCFRVPPNTDEIPDIYAHVIDNDGRFISDVTIHGSKTNARMAPAPRERYVCYYIYLSESMLPMLHTRGFQLGVVVGDNMNIKRWRAESELPVDPVERCVILGSVAPNPNREKRDFAGGIQPPATAPKK